MRVKIGARATGGWPATWPRKPKCSTKNCCARYSPEARLKSPKMFPFFRPFLQAKGPISRDVNGRFFSVAAIALQNAPGGASTMELEANEETSLVRLLAINDFALHGRSLVDRGNLYLIPRLPAVERAHSHAARTEIVGVGLFFDFAPPVRQGRDSRRFCSTNLPEAGQRCPGRGYPRWPRLRGAYWEGCTGLRPSARRSPCRQSRTSRHLRGCR